MKKVLSVLLTAIMMLSVVTTVGAVSVKDVNETGDSVVTGKVYFEKPKWDGDIFYTHIWESESGTSFFSWQMKKEKMEEENGKLAYDLSVLNDESAQLSGGLKKGVDYTIMFCDNKGTETCGLMFNTDCIGDTARVISVEPKFENTEDSSKFSYAIGWTINKDKYGLPFQITSVGTIQGEFIPKNKTPEQIIDEWDQHYPDYPNETDYSTQSSARDHQTRLAEIKKEVRKMIDEGKIKVTGVGVYKDDKVPAPKISATKLALNAGAVKTLKVTNGKVKTWATSKKTVATVKNGKVTALSKGSAKVTATLTNGKKLTCNVTVKTDPKLSKTSVNVKKGKTVTVKLTGKATAINNKYTSTKIAKVTSKANATAIKVKGLKKGNTTVKIKVNGVKTLSLKVKVK